MATSSNPAIRAQATYDRACGNFERALDSYLYTRERFARDDAASLAALRALQSSKRVRIAAWAAYQSWRRV